MVTRVSKLHILTCWSHDNLANPVLCVSFSLKHTHTITWLQTGMLSIKDVLLWQTTWTQAFMNGKSCSSSHTFMKPPERARPVWLRLTDYELNQHSLRLTADLPACLLLWSRPDRQTDRSCGTTDDLRLGTTNWESFSSLRSQLSQQAKPPCFNWQSIKKCLWV